MEYKAVLFDADGTLLDSWKRMSAGHNAVFESCQLPLPDRVEIIKHFGPPYERYYHERGVNLSRCEIFDIYWEASKHVPVSAFDDVHWAMEKLHAMGLKLGIVSGQCPQIIRDSLNGCVHYVGIIVGRVEHKVHELRLICKSEGWTPGEVLYVGDFADDMKAGRESGVVPVGITRGESLEDPEVHHTAQILMDAGASATVFNLYELERLIQLRLRYR